MSENDKVQWNGEFGENCNLPIDCVHCDIIECPGRASEIPRRPETVRKWRRLLK